MIYMNKDIDLRPFEEVQSLDRSKLGSLCSSWMTSRNELRNIREISVNGGYKTLSVMVLNPYESI